MKRKDDVIYTMCKKVLKDKKDLIGAEIGVYEGDSAKAFLDSGCFKEYYCIDAWESGYDDANDIISRQDMRRAEAIFDSKFCGDSRIIKIKSKSENTVDRFKDESLDFIYIDSCLKYEYVIKTLNQYIPKVKKGGLITGHDYHPCWPGVRKAVLEYFGRDPITVYPDGTWYFYNNPDKDWLSGSEVFSEYKEDGHKSNLVAHISFYYTENRLGYLNTVVEGLLTIPDSHIYIHTNKQFDSPIVNRERVELVVHNLGSENPHYLTWKSREYIKSQRSDYNYYVYIEDDILFNNVNFEFYKKYHNICRVHGANCGFIRTEDKDGQTYITDFYTTDTAPVSASGVKFVSNHGENYCAMWIVDSDELQDFIEEYNDVYEFRSLPYGNNLGMIREQAAIGPRKCLYSKTFIRNEPGCLVKHLPNNYVHMLVSNNAKNLKNIPVLD